MEEWKEYKLGDVCDLVPGFAFKSKDFGIGDNRAIKIKDIQPPYVETKDADYVDVSAYDEKRLSKFLVNKGEFLLAMTGATIGKIGKYINNEPSYVNQRVLKFKDIGTISYNYLYYYLSTDTFQSYINNHIDSQSAQPNISANTIGKYPIVAPDKKTQHKIASILSSLDDKIELNRKINANLEAQAQALFKSWFVDFEPFKDQPFVESELGMIPEGWRVGEIGDYCNIRSGFAFKSSWWSDNGIKVIKIKNITEDGRIDISDCSFVSKEHAMLAKEFQTKVGDLLIAMTGATIGKFCIIPTDTPMCVNQRVGKFFLGDKPLEKLPFIYYNLKRPNIFEEIVRKGQGSAQPNISGKDIESIKLVFPPDSIISRFNQSAIIYIKRGILNEQESRRLASLRDTLLPRLMSGELKVNEVI